VQYRTEPEGGPKPGPPSSRFRDSYLCQPESPPGGGLSVTSSGRRWGVHPGVDAEARDARRRSPLPSPGEARALPGLRLAGVVFTGYDQYPWTAVDKAMTLIRCGSCASELGGGPKECPECETARAPSP
jgi:hypothetical protein